MIQLAETLDDTSDIPAWQTYAANIKVAANNLLWDEAQGMYRDNQTTNLAPQDGNVWAVLSNLTQTPAQIESISANLAARWSPYGAPAPEAGNAVCPFISGLELQTHMAAGNTKRALSLMRNMWAYMLDAPGMTNSTFMEGYAVDGSHHYQPYTNDPKISYAHGWASGPTSFLTFSVAGIRLISPAGSEWRIEPNLGDLKKVEAGFSTDLGEFRVSVSTSDDGKVLDMMLDAPVGTKGSLKLQHRDCRGWYEVQYAAARDGDTLPENSERGVVDGTSTELNDLQGGTWDVVVFCDEV